MKNLIKKMGLSFILIGFIINNEIVFFTAYGSLVFLIGTFISEKLLQKIVDKVYNWL
ncbi:hypothetical protein [Campylobacter sp. RM12651]|uniref:hypothetical protein n=1 Tax=Campylobacter sp. RM12651 TaxID=1660079 RepID=UPI001EFAA430|nr:hypothetical protein [Campylobacter sp. RM12651]ULO04593.1 hypothetical protein AVBRAN_a0111 [Campylobacter sp. RM12651]